MKLYTAKLVVAFTELGFGTGWIMGPMMMSGLITVRSKEVFFSSTNFHAACSANFLEQL